MGSVKTVDIEYLSRALRIAAKGIYTTHPNPRVGCVLAKRDKIISEGYHLRAGAVSYTHLTLPATPYV